MTSLRGVTRSSDPSSVTLAGKDFLNSGPKVKTKNAQLKQKTSVMKCKPPNINQSERHLTQLNMPEVCLDKTIESCLKVVLSKTLPTPRNIHKMPMNGGDGTLVAYWIMTSVPNKIKVTFPLMPFLFTVAVQFCGCGELFREMELECSVFSSPMADRCLLLNFSVIV